LSIRTTRHAVPSVGRYENNKSLKLVMSNAW
jgi:hypothetical protein